MSEKVEVSVLEALSLLGEGYSLADLAGVKPEQMEALYALAYQYYNAENFEDAANIFKALCLYDPSDERFFMGLAACQQSLKQYKIAADTYSVCSVLSGLKDPKPMYFAALCLLKDGRRDEAVVALKSLEIMGRDGEFADEDHNYMNKGAQLLQVLESAAGKEA
ncbi:MAG: SycD/LcrH family type III secretion system chaperone [Proteobacteria bacterium]|uniref:SycD/LcrH family type III secretion system chaperone n=1 Tax=Candidatus Avisuccinivibrio stercorigallinarum TaxID=2840704 RepID=A0A9D9DDJ1_9GAMM|nr:SycD/LcrH family type III secretion system chaperone [Candidatus Avisuccinivibrio stercorigallinarum]